MPGIEVIGGRMKANRNGFTLIELMVAMAVSGIMMAVIYASYQSQIQSRITQQETVNMNQNLRAAMILLEREIRLAGTDPTGNAGARIIEARSDYIHFTRDINGGESDSIDNDHDGTVDDPDEWYNGSTSDRDEEIEYKLTNDANQDGVADGFPCALGRQVGGGGGFSVVADNIASLNFVYLDASGNIIAPPGTGSAVDDIRSVRVTITARTEKPVMMRGSQNRQVQLTTEIRCRDLGLSS